MNDMPSRKHHRLPRDCYQGGDIFFLTICTAARGTILTTDPVYTTIKKELDAETADAGGPVHAYMVMPDHLHLLIAGTKDVATWVRRLKSRTTYFSRKAGFTGDVWQKGFYDEGIRNPEKAGEIFRYMAMNPVEAGLVEKPEEWTFKYGC